jgi:hypothetical protein
MLKTADHMTSNPFSSFLHLVHQLGSSFRDQDIQQRALRPELIGLLRRLKGRLRPLECSIC